MRSGQNLVGIKKAIFVPFLTFARDATFTPHNITQAFLACGICPLNPRRVLGKVSPLEPKRRDTIGVVKHPETSQDIRRRVLSATQLLTTLQLAHGPEKELKQHAERVRNILRDLGHQLEEQIAEKEIWQEITHRLQGVDVIYNATDKRKLSEARVLSGKDLMMLRDARLAKNEKSGKKRPMKRATKSTSTYKRGNTRKGRTKQTDKRRVQQHRPCGGSRGPRQQMVLIEECHQIALVDSEDDTSSDNESEEISDEEWDQLSSRPSVRQDKLAGHDPPIRSSALPDQPLHMSLRSRKSHLPLDLQN
jgi:hypothetical protein